MDFEKPLNNEPENTESDIEKVIEISDTNSFRIAVESGRLEEAEAWLMENQERGDARWLDHRSLELFRAYRQKQDWEGARRMIDLAQNEDGRRGRRLKLAEESGQTY